MGIRLNRMKLNQNANLKIYTECSITALEKKIKADPYLMSHGGTGVCGSNEAEIRFSIKDLENSEDLSYTMLDIMWNGALALVESIGNNYVLQSIHNYEIRELSQGVKDFLTIAYPNISFQSDLHYTYFSCSSEECKSVDDLLLRLPSCRMYMEDEDRVEGWKVVMVYNGERNFFKLVEVR